MRNRSFLAGFMQLDQNQWIKKIYVVTCRQKRFHGINIFVFLVSFVWNQIRYGRFECIYWKVSTLAQPILYIHPDHKIIKNRNRALEKVQKLIKVSKKRETCMISSIDILQLMRREASFPDFNIRSKRCVFSFCSDFFFFQKKIVTKCSNTKNCAMFVYECVFKKEETTVKKPDSYPVAHLLPPTGKSISTLFMVYCFRSILASYLSRSLYRRRIAALPRCHYLKRDFKACRPWIQLPFFKAMPCKV